MNSRPIFSTLKDILQITFASVLFGAGLSLFLDPNHLAPGGISGVSVILGHVTGIPSGTWYLLINLPILLLGLWKFGLKFILKTAYAVFTTSLAVNLWARVGAVTDDLFLAALAGPVLMAAGIGLIFRAGATTGGSDIIVKVLRTHFRHLKTGFLFQCFDVCVVTASGFIFRDIRLALYALLAVLICGKALDYVLYGSDEARMIYIITDKPEQIGQRLLHEVDVGFTYLHGFGGYTDLPRRVILCVVHKKLGPAVQEAVKSEDPNAFMIMSSASEIYGLGYKDISADQL